MHTKIIKNIIFLISFALLTACNGFFEKDNTPPPKALIFFTPEMTPRELWSKKVGSGVGYEYLKLAPTLGERSIFTSSPSGLVTSISKQTGQWNWRTNVVLPISTSPGVGDCLVVVGSRKGDLVAIQEQTGKRLWQVKVPGEILATPAIEHEIVVVKTTDGFVRGLAASDGHELWAFQQTEPTLILRGSSKPLIRDHNVIVGFANGNLAKLGLNEGQLVWLQPVAIPEGGFAIQRMIDIDADPILFDHRIFAATYQGQIASLDWYSGQIHWSHDISTYTGMVADEARVYVSDARGFVWAFNADSGLVAWRQHNLEARGVTSPANMCNYIVVADALGYLHWLDKTDGHFVARVKAGTGFYAAPVVENNVLYALTTNGYLVAYTINR